jgi:hypothetical protein
MMALSMQGLAATLVLAGVLGCAPAGKHPEPNAGLAPFVHDRLPDDVGHPTFIDFGGKVHLVGYDVSPEGVAPPGKSVNLKLYWQRSGDLQPGWSLFTHLEDDLGRQVRNFDREGPFRAALGAKPEGLSELAHGRIYSDEQTFEMPKAEDLTPRVAVVVGVWSNEMRLPVMSGSSNGHDAAIVTHFSTGVVRRAPSDPSQGSRR